MVRLPFVPTVQTSVRPRRATRQGSITTTTRSLPRAHSSTHSTQMCPRVFPLKFPARKQATAPACRPSTQLVSASTPRNATFGSTWPPASRGAACGPPSLPRPPRGTFRSDPRCPGSSQTRPLARSPDPQGAHPSRKTHPCARWPPKINLPSTQTLATAPPALPRAPRARLGASPTAKSPLGFTTHNSSLAWTKTQTRTLAQLPTAPPRSRRPRCKQP